MTAHEWADVLEGVAHGISEAARTAADETASAVKVRAIELSQGGLSSRELAHRGHPYSRKRYGSPQAPIIPINRQSGIFSGAWRRDSASEDEDAVIASVFNVAPHARFLYDERSGHSDGGTDRMFGRPLPEAIAEEFEPVFEDTLAAHLGRLF